MKYIILNAFLFGLIFTSSHSSAQDKTKKMFSDGTEEQQSQKPDRIGEEGIDGMTLNSGKKWEMDKHTRQSFNDMTKSFLNIDIGLLNQDELKSQGAILKESLDGLISGCTMEGEPHDQLHIFLMGYIPEVESLLETGSINNAENIQHYLQNYSKYFY